MNTDAPTTPTDGPNVGYRHPAYLALLPVWTRVSDCAAGEIAIKAKGEMYLPKPATNDGDDPSKVKERYNSYRSRALFYGATGRTLDGLKGEVFSRDSTFELPTPLEQILPNLDGDGRSAEQVAKEALSAVLQHGRCGLLADYPKRTDEQGQTIVATVADLNSGHVRPRVVQYSNWEQHCKNFFLIKEK